MRQDDEQYSSKSESYRKAHLQAVRGLYGDKQDIPVEPNTKRKVKRRINPLGEGALQTKLVQWAKFKGLTLISIPNHGKRSSWSGHREVMMGLTRGVSDLFLTHPANGYCGFWIELKTPGKCPTFDQYAWLTKMRKLGYQAEWFDNFEKACAAIEQYLYGVLPAA